MSGVVGGWVALFSGGKDSSWALHRALEADYDVRRLAIVHPPAGSHMYHAPGLEVAHLAARSIAIPALAVGLPVVDVEPPDIGEGAVRDSRDGATVEPLESALRTLAADFDGGLAGVGAGTVSSEFQADRLRSMCDRLGCDFRAPLWGADPRTLAVAMIDGGLEIVIAEVTAPGFDESWLGRPLDRNALADLEELHREYGTHLLGEDGEFETIVTDGPHMSRPIELEFEREWKGTWGRIRITDAHLAGPAPGDTPRDPPTRPAVTSPSRNEGMPNRPG